MSATYMLEVTKEEMGAIYAALRILQRRRPLNGTGNHKMDLATDSAVDKILRLRDGR